MGEWERRARNKDCLLIGCSVSLQQDSAPFCVLDIRYVSLVTIADNYSFLALGMGVMRGSRVGGYRDKEIWGSWAREARGYKGLQGRGSLGYSCLPCQ